LAMSNLYFPITSHVEKVIQDHFGVEKFDVMVKKIQIANAKCQILGKGCE
jgi:hypothetical protein